MLTLSLFRYYNRISKIEIHVNFYIIKLTISNLEFKFCLFIILPVLIIYFLIGDCGDWGLGIGDWGLGPIPNPPSPIPNPQSPLLCIKLNLINTKNSKK